MIRFDKRLVGFLFLSFLTVSCRSEDGGRLLPEALSVKLNPAGGIYPQYSTFYITIEVNKEAELCYTVREKDNPKPCEREYVFRVKAKAKEPVTVPVVPEYSEGATTGVFFLKVFARSKSGEEVMAFGRYEIVLVPFVTVLPPGGFYPQDITVTLSCNKPCYLYYSTDGSEPKEKAEDSVILSLADDAILQVYSEDKLLGIRSEIVRHEYYIDKKAPETKILGLDGCACVSGCDKEPKEVVRCDKEVTVTLTALDDKSPTSEIFWSLDGADPKDEFSYFVEAGGNTYRAKDSVDVPIRGHTMIKFFSKDLAGNRENVKTVVVLIGNKPFAYAVPPGGVFGKDKIPLRVRIFSIPSDATISYTVSFPDATTMFSDSCSSPCEVILRKEGKNIITFRAFKGGLYDEQRRGDYLIDTMPPSIQLEPVSCFSDSGPISATIKSNEERVRVFWKICDKEMAGCGMDECDSSSPDVLSGTAPVTNITIEIPSFVFYCGADLAGNKTDVKKADCEVSGKYEEEFNTQDNMDIQETDASWGGGKLVLKKGSVEKEGDIETAGSGTIDIDFLDKIVAIVDRGFGLRLIDISSPSAPGVISSMQNSGVISSEIWNDIVFVLSGSSIDAYDISNPRSPKKVGGISLSELAIAQNEANYIKVWGRYLVVSAGEQGVVLLMISHNHTTTSRTVSFRKVGSIVTSRSGASSNKVDTFGNLLAVAEGSGGLHLISIENPDLPQTLAAYSDFLRTGELATAVKFMFPYVAVGTNAGNLYLLSISQPYSVELVSSIPLDEGGGSRVNHIELWGLFLIVADNQGIKFVDVQDPRNPYVTYRLSRGPSTYTLPYGDRLLVGDGNSGLYIYKISYPFGNAYELSTFGASVRRVSANGAFGFISGSTDVKILEILNPFSPLEIASVQMPASAPDVRSHLIWGDILAVGDRGTLRFFRVLPFDSIEHIVSLDLSSIRSDAVIEDIVGWGDYVLVAGRSSVFMVPISNINSLSIRDVTSYDTPAFDLEVVGDVLYVSGRSPRVVALRIRPDRLHLILDNIVSASVYEISSFGRYILTAQSISGLIFYDISQMVFGRMAQVGSVYLSQVVGLENFGYYTLVFRDEHISLVDNTYIDRLREVYSVRIRASQGDAFGGLALAAGPDGKARIIRFARESFTYLSESKAQSRNLTPDLSVSIRDAQLVVSFCETQSPNCEKVGCGVRFQLTNNGGATWVDVPPNAGFFPFGSTGSSLMWRAVLRSGDPLVTPEICRVVINYRFGRY